MRSDITSPLARAFAATLEATVVLASVACPIASAQPSNAAPESPPTFNADDSYPGVDWERDTPQAEGFSDEGLARAVAYAQQVGSTSGMVVHGGRVVAEWGDVARKTSLHSARKSFMSALVGIAVARGQMHLDDTLERLGIDDQWPSLSPTEKRATVRMLLQARSGVYHPAAYETAAMRVGKPPRHSHRPGTFWYYNNWDFNTVGAIYRQAADADIFTALKTEIADPVGMQDFQSSDGRYVPGGAATRYPAYPFAMSARDLARFALLYLRDGRWRGRQVVPAGWVAESTRAYSDTPTGGYGYMWWTSGPASGSRDGPNPMSPPAFWAKGHFGQYAVVVPSRDLVVVSLVDTRLTRRRMATRQMETLVEQVESAGATPGPVTAIKPTSTRP